MEKNTLGVVALAFLILGRIVYIVRSLPDLCGNQVISSVLSPNGKMKSIAFERDCGATTDFSTQVSILAVDNTLANEGGNTFSANTNHGASPSGQGGGPEVRLRWLSDTRLQIQHHQLAGVLRAETESNKVKVEYTTFK